MPSLQKFPFPIKPLPGPEAIQPAPKMPVAKATAEPDLIGRAFLLQPWITIRGTASAPNAVKSVTQDDALWMDLRRFADAGLWLELSGVTLPSGGGSVYLNIESSPTLDESDFRLVAPAVALATRSDGNGNILPIFIKTTRTATTVPLSRYTRWRLSTDGTSGVWDASFRIRGVGGFSRFWLPTDIAGCNAWFRADLGVTINSGNGRVSDWSDQSGKGNHASQITAANQPALGANAMNGFPALQGDGANYYMTTTNNMAFGSSATFIAAVKAASSSQTNGSRLIESRYDTSYYLATDIPPVGPSQHYKWVVNSTSPPYGLAEGGAIATVSQIVTGTYSSSTTKGTLYLDGAQIAQDTFTAPGTVNTPLYIMRAFSYAGSYWNGYLAEAIVYDHALTPNEFAAVHRYLGSRYGVVIS